MSGLYVASNVTALGAQVNLQRNMGALTEIITRLSTGLRINSGKDDPSGLIASELLKSDITATKQAIQNTTRANSVIAIADSALGQISALLNDVRGLVNSAANTGAMTVDQIQANQLQVDASLDSIDRIAKTTNYQGQKLLDGSMSFKTTGVDRNAIQNLNIQSANFGTADQIDVKVDLMEQAQKATLIYKGTGVGQDTVVQIGGSEGSEIFSFGAGTTTSQMAEAINRLSDSTGVVASVTGLAQRGSVTISSPGGNNDIVITANSVGYDAGNYTFVVKHGANNDVRIVSDPTATSPGVVEISLIGTYEKTYPSFAGMFNLTVNTDFAGDNASTQPTSAYITQGTANSVQFFQEDANASGTTSTMKTMSITGVGTGASDHMSALNGWTILCDNSAVAGVGNIDRGAKTIRINSADLTVGIHTADSLASILQAATSVGGITLDISANFADGDKLTLGGGGSAGELYVTYKEGATVGDIQDLINKTSYVQATTVDGVNRKDLVKDIPSGSTYVRSVGGNSESAYTSGATSQTVIDLINSKLGDKFTAVALKGDMTGGKVTYQDAYYDYGDPNLDNAIRFTGMDSGPIVRLTAASPNQQLAVKIIQPSDADIKNGVHTPILEIMLATDASGNSTTTAAQLAAFFDQLSAKDTLGVSAELLLPPGVDPNGRTWTSDICGNEYIVDDCPPTYGHGIVQPTGEPGPCEVQESDLALIGQNQEFIKTAPIGRIASSVKNVATTVPAANGVTATSIGNDTTPQALYLSSMKDPLWNGLQVVFTSSDRTAATTPGAAVTSVTGGVITIDLDTDLANTGTAATKWSEVLTLLNAQATRDLIVADDSTKAGILGNVAFTDATGATALTPTASSALAAAGVTFGSGQAATEGSSGAADATGTGFTLADTISTVTLNGEDAAGAPTGSSILNGINLVLKSGSTTDTGTFDAKTGTFTISILSTTNSATDVQDAIAAAIAANFSALKAFNGSHATAPIAAAEITFDGFPAGGTATASDIFGTEGVTYKMGGGLTTGDVIETRAKASVAIAGGDSISIETDRTTSALNGVTFNFTTDPKQAGFSTTTGALTVFLDATTIGKAPGGELSRAVTEAVNGAIAADWEAIRDYTKTSESIATVTVNTDGMSGTEILTNFGNTVMSLQFPSSFAAGTAGSTRGTSVTDPGLLIEANSANLGLSLAGTKIIFQQDDTLQESTTTAAYIATEYKNGVLTIRANTKSLQSGTDGGIGAKLLAEALNNDTTFNTYFKATAPITGTDGADTSVDSKIAFSLDTTPRATMVGGYGIKSSPLITNSLTATSNGIPMTGQSDADEQLILQARDYGSANFVDVEVIEGLFNTYCPLGVEMNHLDGTDAVVTVNGLKAVANGNNVTLSSSTLQMTFTLSEYMQTGDSSYFAITGGGATFQLGPDVVSAQQIRIGIPSVNTTQLGGLSGYMYQLRTGGTADLSTDTKLADRIVQDAINSVTVLRGRLGALQKCSLEPNIAALEDTVEQMASAEADISNADFAEESSRLTRTQILVQSGAQVLAIANQIPQYAAMLLS